MTEPTIEKQVRDLNRAGWREVDPVVWRAPWGALYRGPHQAWKIMKTLRECALPAGRRKPTP